MERIAPQSLPIKTVLFKHGQDFLRHYREMDGDGGIVIPSRLRYEPDEIVVLELFFPPMPNRIHLRAMAVPHLASQGFAAFRFETMERAKKDFLLKAATSKTKARRRRYRRYPTNLEVTWHVDGVALRHPAKLRDLSRGGLSLTTEWPPPVGTDIVTHVLLPDDPVPLVLSGRVTWIAQTTKQGAMGIQFFSHVLPEMKRLRRFLNQLNDSGIVPSVQPKSQPRRSADHQN